MFESLTVSDGGGEMEESMRGLKGYEHDSGKRAESQGFGGLTKGEGEVPVCKHLLACYLAESWGGFGGYVEERDVGTEEMSGWAAGWGG